MYNILLTIGSKLFYSLLTEVFVRNFVIRLMKEAAKRTTNTLDDDIVKEVDSAWQIGSPQ